MQEVKLQLICLKICPYAQRIVIALREKAVPVAYTYLDPDQHPEWFRTLSPLGKSPVLRVGEDALLESVAISEYLEEVYAPALHPSDPLRRAHNRAWIEFATGLTLQQYHLGLAPDKAGFERQRNLMEAGLERLEGELGNGPYFNGADFSLVDASLAPFFMRLALLEPYLRFDYDAARPRLAAYRDSLLARTSVTDSVVSEFTELFLQYFRGKGGHVAGRLPVTAGAAD